VILFRIRALLFALDADLIFYLEQSIQMLACSGLQISLFVEGNQRFATLPHSSASHERPLNDVTLDVSSDRKEDHGWIGNY
jgi:hypothetical protein